jgi:hypothetical protein
VRELALNEAFETRRGAIEDWEVVIGEVAERARRGISLAPGISLGGEI